MRSCILTVNAGSSSIRCAKYELGDHLAPQLKSYIKIDRIGKPDARLTVKSPNRNIDNYFSVAQHRDAIALLLKELSAHNNSEKIIAVGHRVVHGMQHSQPQEITASLRDELRRMSTLDPEHLPFEIELIDALQQQYPSIPHIACFDTAFHRTLPKVAQTLPLPMTYRDAVIEHYGFHGLSYAYLMQELARLDSRTASNGRIIIAHLGNGASLAAIRNGVCIDTTMGFSPASGIMMSTRSGDIDPGVLYYLETVKGIGMQVIQSALNHESGMLGVSGVSGDVRDLLACEHTNPHAALALDMFCYQIKKTIGAYTAALGGLDTLIFSGGIGENATAIRQRICDGLGIIGIYLDDEANSCNESVISTRESITVRVMKTDEELMIARSVANLLNKPGAKQS